MLADLVYVSCFKLLLVRSCKMDCNLLTTMFFFLMPLLISLTTKISFTEKLLPWLKLLIYYMIIINKSTQSCNAQIYVFHILRIKKEKSKCFLLLQIYCFCVWHAIKLIATLRKYVFCIKKKN